ncbi:hypothetical protein NIIDMKKI_05810 [Mycobacterium kansasii]|uniref:Amidase domain-containing protein n=1 Tax=Mycobacterium kansasii TaxID=1768 RepID=A0A7G1I682_MYCKA|nr:hypothetical protein NIIDMKKI_05810 [Mycobacterium kansasii]
MLRFDRFGHRGSIRFPTSMCGVTGIKPTWGRVSRYGIVELAASFDHVGPIARSAADAAVLLSAIAGFDVRDPMSSRTPVPDYAADLALSRVPGPVWTGRNCPVSTTTPHP